MSRTPRGTCLMTMSDVILQTSRLTKEFKGFTAVSDVNLSVRRGSIHALIGPNGAGKTTCFNLLTKFLEPTSGTIHFNGHDITREHPAQIARRGVIRSFQLSAVFPHLTLMETVRLGLQRKACCQHFRRADGELCDSCPQLPLAERERRLHVGTHRKVKTYMTDKQINLESPTSLTHYLLTITS